MGKQPPIYSFRKKKKPVKSRSEEEAVAEDCETQPTGQLPTFRKKRVVHLPIEWDNVGKYKFGFEGKHIRYVVKCIDSKHWTTTYWPTSIRDKHDGYTFLGEFLSEEDAKKAATFHQQRQPSKV